VREKGRGEKGAGEGRGCKSSLKKVRGKGERGCRCLKR
jgi:hypothetical protein